jgi:hypothetical protein
MKIDCNHWKSCKNPQGGCCALGKYGGRISFGVCVLACAEYRGKKTADDLLKMPPLVEQAKNATKAAANVGKAVIKGEKVIASKKVQTVRKKICNSCDQLDKKSGRCYQCGCQYQFKLATATESCPLEKWLAVVGKT